MYRIKAEYADTIVGFAGSGKRLGLRSQEDLQILAELCAVNKSLIKYFENYPGAEAVAKNKESAVLLATQVAASPRPSPKEREVLTESVETELGAEKEKQRPKHKRPAIVDPDIDAE